MKGHGRSLSGIALAVTVLPSIAFAAQTPQNFQQLATQIVGVLTSATFDLVALALVIFLWGAASHLFKSEHGHYDGLRNQLIWGVLVIFFAVSIWGIVQLLQTTIFGQGDATNGTGGAAGGGTCTSLNCNTPFGSQ